MAAEQLRERTAGLRAHHPHAQLPGPERLPAPRGALAHAEERVLPGDPVRAGEDAPARSTPTRSLRTSTPCSAIRLGLLAPEEAETCYPDAAGIAAAFPAYRDALHAAGRSTSTSRSTGPSSCC